MQPPGSPCELLASIFTTFTPPSGCRQWITSMMSISHDWWRGKIFHGELVTICAGHSSPKQVGHGGTIRTWRGTLRGEWVKPSTLNHVQESKEFPFIQIYQFPNLLLLYSLSTTWHKVFLSFYHLPYLLLLQMINRSVTWCKLLFLIKCPLL